MQLWQDRPVRPRWPLVFLSTHNEEVGVGEVSPSNQKKLRANIFECKLSVTARAKAGASM